LFLFEPGNFLHKGRNLVVFGHGGLLAYDTPILLAYDTPLNGRLNWWRTGCVHAFVGIFFTPLFYCSLWCGIVLGKVLALCGIRCGKFGATDPAFERAVAFLLTFALFVLAALVSGLVFRQVSGPVW
jgi:predicted cobalt transporter CbtA